MKINKKWKIWLDRIQIILMSVLLICLAIPFILMVQSVNFELIEENTLSLIVAITMLFFILLFPLYFKPPKSGWFGKRGDE